MSKSTRFRPLYFNCLKFGQCSKVKFGIFGGLTLLGHKYYTNMENATANSDRGCIYNAISTLWHLTTIFRVEEWQEMPRLKTITYPIANFVDVPDKALTKILDSPATSSNSVVRVVSYNVGTDFFDAVVRPAPGDLRHDWSTRAPIVKQLLAKMDADIICLQELSPDQAYEMQEAFTSDYDAFFLSQTPSEITPTGTIAGSGQEIDVSSWRGKKAGTPLIGTFVRKSTWHLADQTRETSAIGDDEAPLAHVPSQVSIGRFWLNENPDTVPTNADRGITDKGFGNMNTYRAVLWVRLQDDFGHTLYVLNSHYPLSGDSKTRLECAKVEMRKIQEISGNNLWVSAGDRNLIPDKSSKIHEIASTGITRTEAVVAKDEICGPEEVYKVLTSIGRDVCDHQQGYHYGASSTWLGFTKDPYKAEINPANPADCALLDIIVSNMKSKMSFIHPGSFDPNTGLIIPLASYRDSMVMAAMNEGRFFASDHALLGGDFDLSYVVQ